ncbi:histidinol-phosphate transaminase [Marivita sp. GX14005]|uniref:histidinol-phosphate transaminase n=1 Tax=Marivita sp. GX14005 TaxID=2942276 RepID=UPI002018DB6D|nr:histidinol-phosphate transaminase [Marivita sp. GX14005]MCL3881842.1 histidinol-phosphate transaminase [Marivita sp. GX14005]
MTKITPQPGIMDIALYVAGSSHIDGVSNVVKLSSNENPFGPSPTAQEAVRRAVLDLHRYPPTDHAGLRNAIAEVYDLDAERIACGVGSDELLSLMSQAYAGPGDEVVHTEHGFALYRICALAAGATPIEVSEHERVTDVDAILAACTEKTRLVFIANPNNPTGTMIGLAEIERLADKLPPRVLLVLDGAYAEFVEGYDGGARLVETRENVVMTRTFSKIYGLGGLRIGWCYAPKPVIDVINRIRGPFNLSSAALAAAEAAVRDTAYVEKCRLENARWRAWLAEALAGHGVPSDTSMANFILARFSDESEAEACNQYLQKQGLIVRQVGSYNLPYALRITIGDEASCRRVAHAIGQFKAGER